MMMRLTGLFVGLSLSLCASAATLDVERDDVRTFVDELVAEHDFDRDALNAILSTAQKQQSILDAISRPAEKTKPWYEYRDIFIKPNRIDAGVAFWNEHADTIASVSAETGVPGEILVGIIGVETFFGRITGKYRVLDALVTLGFDYPPRAGFFRRELGEFLILAREESVDIDSALGSYAGAMGSPQFIPSSYRAYAVDGNNDGRRDLWGNWHDVISSVANYFVRHQWRASEEVVSAATLGENFRGSVPEKNELKADNTVQALSRDGVGFSTGLSGDSSARLIAFDGEDGPVYYVGFHNFYVITRYNRSTMYALAVWQLGNEIAAARNTALAARSETS